MLSKKTRYAMVALVYIARENEKGAIMSTEIAKNERLPQRFLENILLELKKMGLLGSKPGKAGGYFLLKPPEEITLAEIVRHFEGAVAMLRCVSEKSYQACEFCKDEITCKIRNVFKEIRDTTYNILSRTTLKDLI
ncbi:MAG: Rrf2 family transcriptional regulator [Bacteroidetes bacterium]|nr:Rrf2 family transcriptional regulator [Bacteroidales bacterium]NJO68234.1 Rrf2 family transcriptional regulator [Bacteroidota bacterium]